MGMEGKEGGKTKDERCVQPLCLTLPPILFLKQTSSDDCSSVLALDLTNPSPDADPHPLYSDTSGHASTSNLCTLSPNY